VEAGASRTKARAAARAAAMGVGTDFGPAWAAAASDEPAGSGGIADGAETAARPASGDSRPTAELNLSVAGAEEEAWVRS
jgi:hypothetical protein